MAVAMRSSVKAARPSRASTVKVSASIQPKQLMSIAGAAVLSFATLAPIANATPLVDELLAKSTVNKAINDKKRLATSYANLARSRTVTDATCAFPENFFGCEELALNAGVKYIADDIKLECDGKGPKDCASKPTMRTK